MSKVYEALKAGFYDTKQSYPTKTQNGYKEAKVAYLEDLENQEEAFKIDLFEEEGVTDNPKAELCYDKARELGQGNGLSEIYNHFVDLVELIK